MNFGGDISRNTYVIYMNGNLGQWGGGIVFSDSLNLHGGTLTNLPRKVQQNTV